MAQHETYSLGIDTNFDSVLKANKAINAMYEGLKKVDSRFSGMHAPRGLPAEINHMSAVTASYVQRLQSEGKTYEANKVKVKAYAESLDNLKRKQSSLENQLGKIAEKSGKNSEKYKEQEVRINATATSINHLQKEMDRLHPTGFNKLTSDAKKASDAVDSIKTHMHNAFNSMKAGAGVAAAGIGAIGATAMSGAKMAGALQQRYREINNLAVLGGEKQREVTKSITEMQRQGRDMSIKYGKSQQEIAAGYEDLVKRGYTTKQAVGALKTELQASVASGDKFSDVTTVSSQVLDAFGMKANSTGKMLSNTRKVVNELAYSADATSTGFGDLGTAMSYVGTAAKSNNISLAETASALGVLSNNGLESDKAGTALRATINGLTNQVNKIGSKNSIFTKLGIKKSEMVDAHGNLKGLSQDMAVLYKHIEEHSKGGSDQNGFFKSIFGTTGMNGAMILAKSSKEVEDLTKRTEKAGKTGKYVSELAAKNMGTAQGSANSARQAMNAFKMTLGNAVLPAINEASNSLAKFLLSKDGEKFQKNVGKVVGDFANGLVSLIRFATQHETMMKFVGGGFLAGYATVKAAKAVSFVGGLYEQYKRLTGITPKIKDLENVTSRSAGVKSGLSKYLTGNRLVFGATVAFSAAQIGTDFYKAATAKSTQDRIADVGAGAGNLIGTGIGAALGGKAGAAIGSQLGQAMGPAAAKSFNKAFNPNTRFNLKNPKPIAHGKRHIVQYTENGYYYTIGKGKRKYFKDQRNYSEKELNTGHRLDATQFLQAKNPVDFVTGALSGGYQVISHLNDLDYLRRSTKFANASSQKGWFNDFFFKPMGKPKFKDHGDIGKGFRTAIGNWFRSKPNAGRAYESTPGEKWLASLFGGDKVQAAELTKAQRKALRNGKTIGENATKGAKAGMKDFPSWTKQLSAKSNKWFKSKWNGMRSWAGGVNKNVQSGWHGFTSWSGNLSHRSSKFFKSKWSGMQSWAGGINKDVQSGWKGIKTWFGNLGKNAVDLFKKPFEGLSKWVSDHTPKPVKAALGAVGKGINWVKGKLTGKAHANGGTMHTTHGALVGEAGPELAYKPYANHVRLLGANGPQFTKVHAGEHILNARDTAKVLNGGLGNGLMLKGYASGTDKLKRTSKSVTDDYKAIASKSTKSLKKLTRSNKQAFKQVNTDANKQTKQTKTRTVANFKQMHHGINKQMDAIHDGVIRSSKSTAKGFGGAMDKMHKYAHTAMADTTHQLNKGISSIDKVLGQFGGNNSVIKPIKFAKGTDQQGRLTHNTLAMVNDATQGPRQEALVSPDNRLYLPKGQNVRLMLPKGWGVLNGTQTKQVTNKTINHFAKGTGISHSALRKLAEKANADPSKWFKSTYSNDIKQHGSDLNKGTTALGSNSSTKYGNHWSNALWGVINKQIDSDDGGSINATGLLKAAERYGEGHRYVWGATGPSTFDCSGLVMYTLKKAYGINYPHFSGSQYNMTRHISKAQAHMGDLVFWGAGGSDHVGIYAGGNKYFSAESPSQGIHMNTLDSVVGKGRPLFGRIKGMPAQKSKAKHVKKPDNRLTALVKRELGSRAIKWIKDNLGDDFGSLGSFSVGSDLKERARALAGGLKKLDPRATKAGIAAILGNWNFESVGLNPSAVNSGGGASGLGQWLGSRLTNLKAYARRHGTSWKNAGTQLSFAVKGEGSDSAILRSILEGHGSVASLANRFSAEWERGGYNAQHVRGAMQVAKALGFAKGGRPKVGQNVIVGEHGPEIARFDSPVQIYSNEKSRRSLNLGKLPDVQHASTKKHFSGKFAPVININFNGSASDFDSKQARKIAEIVQRELEKVFNSIDEEFC